jgi:hypothetical protein
MPPSATLRRISYRLHNRAPIRASSADGAIGAMLAAVSAVPSAGQKPASSANTRWHVGQLFMQGRPRRVTAPGYRGLSSVRSLDFAFAREAALGDTTALAAWRGARTKTCTYVVRKIRRRSSRARGGSGRALGPTRPPEAVGHVCSARVSQSTRYRREQRGRLVPLNPRYRSPPQAPPFCVDCADSARAIRRQGSEALPVPRNR